MSAPLARAMVGRGASRQLAPLYHGSGAVGGCQWLDMGWIGLGRRVCGFPSWSWYHAGRLVVRRRYGDETLYGLELCLQLLLGVVPEDDAMPVKDAHQRLLDLADRPPFP